MTEEKILQGFNDAQREAVLYVDGPQLIVAGAGSGKTRVLTHKIAYLLSQGYKPWTILALTFTNKAANEMKDRIANLVGTSDARSLWMGTFHSVFLRILQTEHEAIGFDANFTIYDANDSKSLIKSIIKEMDLDDKRYKPSSVAAIISNAKNELIDAEEYYDDHVEYRRESDAGRPRLRDIYRIYAQRCRGANAMDFDDILLFTYRLFKNHPDILQKYQQRFQYVLVDEYQDTNYVQHMIVGQLTELNQKICVVGDDAQSIYSFRGARIDNILKFSQMFRQARVFRLEQNYRSTQMIVNAANSLIKKNARQIDKTVFSLGDVGDALSIEEVTSDVVEGEMVLRQISKLRRQDGLKYSDFAVLYRTNAQSRIFEEAFRKSGVPYRVYGGMSFYQRKEIKDLIAYFRMAVNPKDEEALRRIINYPARGIGATTWLRIADAATRCNVSLWEVICEPMKYQLQVGDAMLMRLSQFSSLISSFVDYAANETADEAGVKIIQQCGILEEIGNDSSPEVASRRENVAEMRNGLAEFCQRRLEEGNQNVRLIDFLSEVSLVSDLEEDADASEMEGTVSIMTVHAAKGLEFDTVFVVGLEENLFPNEMASYSASEMEEERRLCYVAITRAKNHCFLSYAKRRYHFGQLVYLKPSRFLKEIDSDCVKKHMPKSQIIPPWTRMAKMTAVSHTTVAVPHTTTTPRTTTVTSSTFADGDRVEHVRFGLGTVLCSEGEGAGEKAIIDFDEVGKKQLLLKYAKLKKV